jgi:hypothetical protein
MPQTRIKIFGMERTGTNFMRRVVSEKFPEIRIFDTVLGSKHAGFSGTRLPHRTKFIICTRNLRAWFVSFRRWKIEKYGHEWPANEDDVAFDLSRWNLAHRNWMEVILSSGSGIAVRHSDATGWFRRTIFRLSSFLGVNPINFDPIVEYVPEGGGQSNQEFRREFYLQDAYLNDEALSRYWPLLRQKVDWEVMEKFGITPELSYSNSWMHRHD